MQQISTRRFGCPTWNDDRGTASLRSTTFESDPDIVPHSRDRRRDSFRQRRFIGSLGNCTSLGSNWSASSYALVVHSNHTTQCHLHLPPSLLTTHQELTNTIRETDANTPRTDPDTRGKWYNVTSPLLPLGRQSSPCFLSLCSHLPARRLRHCFIQQRQQRPAPYDAYPRLRGQTRLHALNTARSIPTNKQAAIPLDTADVNRDRKCDVS